MLHGRKRVQLHSSIFGNKKPKPIDVSDVYQNLRSKVEISDEKEFNVIRTPAKKIRRQQGQSFWTPHSCY